jgi:hypothetical protein
MRYHARFATLACLLWIAAPAHSQIAGPCAQCFPLESLPPDVRALSERLLLEALDNEALYTLAGGLKPMSSVPRLFQFSVEAPDLAEVDQIRRALQAWRCHGEIRATVHHFHKIHEGKRSAGMVVFHQPRLAEVLAAKSSFFAPFGLSPHADPMEVLTTIEMEEQPIRLRGQGYLFGYPDAAVEWFVAADAHQRATGQFVARRFLSFPTHVRQERGVVWAVPEDHQETGQDREFAARAAAILAAYRERRARYVGDGKPGVVALLRDWYDDGRGRCSPRHASTP